MHPWLVALLFCATAAAQPPQAGVNFLQDAFRDRPTLFANAGFPRLSLLFANRQAEVRRAPGSADPSLRAPGSEAVMTVRLDHEGVFEICRIRHAPGSPVPPDELKLVWAFPMEFNESMTLDAGALEGHPLYLPDGTVPPAHYLNWGTLFYNREANLAIGTELRGAEPAAARWGRRSGPTGPTQLHFWTSMGHPDLQVSVFVWRPRDARFWWAEWYQQQERRSPGRHPHLFRVLSAPDMSWMPGEQQRIDIVPRPGDAGKFAEFVLIDDVSGHVAGQQRFRYELPVTHVTVSVADWPSGLYRGMVAPEGQGFNPAVRRPAEKMMTLLVRPARPGGSVLFVAPTDMWRAYASNGGHAMTSWRADYHYDNVGYSPTVLNTRFRRTNHYYYGLYERHSDIHHYRLLRELAGKEGLRVDYCAQDDIALGRVRLSDYRLVLVGSRAEFTTAETFLRFREYMAGGGAVMIHGGGSFAVMVEYLPSLRDRRYIWQRDHIWCHLTDQADSFMPPRLLPPDAPPRAPITAPEAGDAIDGSGANSAVITDHGRMRRFVSVEALFNGRHFDRQIIIRCVSWYTSFKLSFRDLVIMMADRGVSLAHTTILRWVRRYLPEFEKRWKRYARAVGGSWRMDETYIKVRGRWVYLYRAVDKAGRTVDFFLSRNRDMHAAKSFLRSVMKNTRRPTKITLDAYAASHRAVREMKEDGELPRRVKVRSSQYLNNLIEQDHRRVKQRIRPMLGFKRFDNAVVTISGIELAEKIKKGQFKTGKLGGAEVTMSELWNAALAA